MRKHLDFRMSNMVSSGLLSKEWLLITFIGLVSVNIFWLSIAGLVFDSTWLVGNGATLVAAFLTRGLAIIIFDHSRYVE